MMYEYICETQPRNENCIKVGKTAVVASDRQIGRKVDDQKYKHAKLRFRTTTETSKQH